MPSPRPRGPTPVLSAGEKLQALSPTAGALRLEWLLQGVLEIQSLITEANFDLQTLMQRIVDVAASLTGARDRFEGDTIDGNRIERIHNDGWNALKKGLRVGVF